jgi:hypothetical protein
MIFGVWVSGYLDESYIVTSAWSVSLGASFNVALDCTFAVVNCGVSVPRRRHLPHHEICNANSELHITMISIMLAFRLNVLRRARSVHVIM